MPDAKGAPTPPTDSTITPEELKKWLVDWFEVYGSVDNFVSDNLYATKLDGEWDFNYLARCLLMKLKLLEIPE